LPGSKQVSARLGGDDVRHLVDCVPDPLVGCMEPTILFQGCP